MKNKKQELEDFLINIFKENNLCRFEIAQKLNISYDELLNLLEDYVEEVIDVAYNEKLNDNIIKEYASNHAEIILKKIKQNGKL